MSAFRLVCCVTYLMCGATICPAQQRTPNHIADAGSTSQNPPGSSLPPVGFGIVAWGSQPGAARYFPGRFGVAGGYGSLELGYLPGTTYQPSPGGLMLPTRERSSETNGSATIGTVPARRPASSRAEELTTVGDRSFRGGNYRRAQERYNLAAKADRVSPTPHIHLAQVDIVRGDYAAAAGHLREGVAASPGPGWLLEVPDIQSMYGEPAEFHKQVAQLESYLQTHPDDRDAWFVLGAQQYFSGRHRAASDTFLRLSDRTADEALVAFRDANTVANRSTAAHNDAGQP